MFSKPKEGEDQTEVNEDQYQDQVELLRKIKSQFEDLAKKKLPTFEAVDKGFTQNYFFGIQPDQQITEVMQTIQNMNKALKDLELYVTELEQPAHQSEFAAKAKDKLNSTRWDKKQYTSIFYQHRELLVKLPQLLNDLQTSIDDYKAQLLTSTNITVNRESKSNIPSLQTGILKQIDAEIDANPNFKNIQTKHQRVLDIMNSMEQEAGKSIKSAKKK